MQLDKGKIESIIDRLLWQKLLNKCPECERELDYSGCDVVGDIADEIMEYIQALKEAQKLKVSPPPTKLEDVIGLGLDGKPLIKRIGGR